MESRTNVWALALATAITVAMPASAQERREFRELHMGVEVRIVLIEPDDANARAAARAAFDRIAELEDVMSDYRAESELRRLERRSGDWVPVSQPLFDVLSRARSVSAATHGAFDPTIGPVVQLWREARRTKRLPAPTALDSARALVGWQRLGLDSVTRSVKFGVAGMRLDLGGIAKGYIVQQAVAVLRAHGVTRSMIAAGGDVATGDAPPGTNGWTLAVMTGRTLWSSNGCVSTSGPEPQSVSIDGVRYSHVVDPRTGLGLTTRWYAIVESKDCAVGDALATALTVLGTSGETLARRHFPDLTTHVLQRPPTHP